MESKDELQRIRVGAVEQLAAIPSVLRELQELVPLLSVAYSTEGRTFGYEAPLSMSIPVGSYVALSAQDGREYLGQRVTKEVSIRQGAELGLELDPSLGALWPKGVNLPPNHTYPLHRRYAHGTSSMLRRLESGGYGISPRGMPARRKVRAEPNLRQLRGTLLRRGRYGRAHFLGSSAEGYLMRARRYTALLVRQGRAQTGGRSPCLPLSHAHSMTNPLLHLGH